MMNIRRKGEPGKYQNTELDTHSVSASHSGSASLAIQTELDMVIAGYGNHR